MKLAEHPTVKAFHQKTIETPSSSVLTKLDADRLRQLCRDAGADDVGLVEIGQRMLILETRRSWAGKEDRKLTAKLAAELPGILRWAIEGWRRLQKRGHFLQPKSSRHLVEHYGCVPSAKGMPEKRDDNGKVVLLVLFVASGLFLAALSVPLIFRKIPPNYWYGFRVRATLENEEVWYPANEYAGKWLLGVGLGTVVAAVALFLMPNTNVGVYASAVGGIVMVGLAVAVIQSVLYLRQFTRVR